MSLVNCRSQKRRAIHMSLLGQLAIHEAAGAIRRVVVQEIMTLGRDNNNDIVLDEPTVSRQHALLLCDADGLRLIDLESTNGTLLNGVPLPPEQPQRLNDGDLIQLGRVLARYSVARPASTPGILS